MSDFLDHLVSATTASTPEVLPRLPSLFEPMTSSGPGVEDTRSEAHPTWYREPEAVQPPAPEFSPASALAERLNALEKLVGAADPLIPRQDARARSSPDRYDAQSSDASAGAVIAHQPMGLTVALGPEFAGPDIGEEDASAIRYHTGAGASAAASEPDRQSPALPTAREPAVEPLSSGLPEETIFESSLPQPPTGRGTAAGEVRPKISEAGRGQNYNPDFAAAQRLARVQPKASEPGRGESHQAPVPPAPVIQVNIGRVEVRAVMPPAITQRRRQREAPAMSLEEYLHRRGGGGTR